MEGKKQSTLSISSAKSKYRSMGVSLSETTWFIGLIEVSGFAQKNSVVLHCDNSAAMQIANNPIFHERTKQIEIDCHYIREKVIKNVMQLKHVIIRDQLAIFFTKVLRSQHCLLWGRLGMRNLFGKQGKIT